MATFKKWLGPAPSYCDICCKPISSTFIDGRTVYGLDTGKGQKYERDNESWVKVAG